jgi:hypothetical protein
MTACPGISRPNCDAVRAAQRRQAIRRAVRLPFLEIWRFRPRLFGR